MLEITVSEFVLVARLEEEGAPATVAAFRRLLPLDSQLIQARWSGQSAWIPFGDLDLGIGFEDPTSYPAPGELLIYPGGVSETEILFPYGDTCFASKAGQLAGNHFATVVEGLEHLPEIGAPRALGRRPADPLRRALVRRLRAAQARDRAPLGGTKPPSVTVREKPSRVCAGFVPIRARWPRAGVRARTDSPAGCRC